MPAPIPLLGLVPIVIFAQQNAVLRALQAEGQRDFPAALAAWNEALQERSGSAELHNRRGMLYFKMNRVEESIADFDRAIAKDPRQAPHHWQRGISLYYAGRYADCARQFEQHRTVNPEDVENAVWHYLCRARLGGKDQARRGLIPVTADDRVPMAEIHAMFAGRATPADVLAAAGRAPPEERQSAHFYAFLYVGLYLESEDRAADSLRHVQSAARDFPVEQFMWEVARIHVERRRGQPPRSPGVRR